MPNTKTPTVRDRIIELLKGGPLSTPDVTAQLGLSRHRRGGVHAELQTLLRSGRVVRSYRTEPAKKREGWGQKDRTVAVWTLSPA